jgi:hypothetical protein
MPTFSSRRTFLYVAQDGADFHCTLDRDDSHGYLSTNGEVFVVTWPHDHVGDYELDKARQARAWFTRKARAEGFEPVYD